MAHTIEPAASGRAKCRGCGQSIAKAELRLGARLPNPFDEDKELTLWFHLLCGAFTRPEPFLQAVKGTKEPIADRDRLQAEARLGLEHPRLTRLRAVERAPTGRATCRSCRKAIPKESWRLALTFYDEVEGRFSPGGFLHVKCAPEYFGTSELGDRVKHFSRALDPSEIDEALSELSASS